MVPLTLPPVVTLIFSQHVGGVGSVNMFRSHTVAPKGLYLSRKMSFGLGLFLKYIFCVLTFTHTFNCRKATLIIPLIKIADYLLEGVLKRLSGKFSFVNKSVTVG
jgi:hypothetical protein